MEICATMKARTHEARVCSAPARVQRRQGSISPFRHHNAKAAFGVTCRDAAQGSRIPQAVACEPPQARAEAKGQAFRFGPRTPRLENLGSFGRFSDLACEFGVGQPLAHDLADDVVETVRIVHRPAIVEAKRLFVNIAEQVEGFHTHVGTAQGALEQAPEVLHAVGVDVAVHVLGKMVHHVVSVLVVHAPKRRARRNELRFQVPHFRE
jgi:hypothetical protein